MNNSRKSKNNNAQSKATLFESIIPKDQISSLHKFTHNTLLVFEKIINKITVANRSNSLPKNYLSITKLIHRGRLICHQSDCFHLTVSESLLSRAIRLLDNLAKALEGSHFKIQSTKGNKGIFSIAIKNNEHVSFKVSEGYKYRAIDRDNKSRSELEKLLYPNKNPIPTGKLTLSVFAYETRIGKSWSDGVRLLEDDLPNIIKAFDSLVLKQKKQRIEDAIKARQRSEHAKILAEKESIKYAEKSIFDQSMQEMETYIALKNLETYLNCLEVNYLNQYGVIDEAALLWLSTARKVAESKNPVIKRLALLNTL